MPDSISGLTSHSSLVLKKREDSLTVGKEMSWPEQVKEHSYPRPLLKKKKKGF